MTSLPIPPKRSPPPWRACADGGCPARRGTVRGTATASSPAKAGGAAVRTSVRTVVRTARLTRRDARSASLDGGRPLRRPRTAADARGAGRGIHPLSVSELGDAVGVDQPRASRLVQQGVELGLVRREADPDDARRTRIALTDQGARSSGAPAGSGARRSTPRSRPSPTTSAPSWPACSSSSPTPGPADLPLPAEPDQKLVTRSPSTAVSLVGSVVS